MSKTLSSYEPTPYPRKGYPCPRCWGFGVIHRDFHGGDFHDTCECPECDGSGYDKAYLMELIVEVVPTDYPTPPIGV